MKKVFPYYVYPYNIDYCPKVQRHKMRRYSINDKGNRNASNRQHKLIEELEYNLEKVWNL